MAAKKDNVRCKEFDGLRFVFCFLIFLNHCTFLKTDPIGDMLFEKCLHNGRFSVSFFFLVSAYFIYSKYGNREIKWTKNECLTFGWDRIKKVYPLYFIGNFSVGVAMLIKGAVLQDVVKDFIISATLLQTLSIKYWGVLNSAGWYVSSLFCLYCITPLLIILVDKIPKQKSLLLSICLLFLIIIMDVVINKAVEFGIISTTTGLLLGYVFPIYWIPSYLLGMVINKVEFISIKKNVFLYFAVFFSFVVYFFGLNGPLNLRKYQASLYIIINWLLIYAFSINHESKLSQRIASSRMALWGGIAWRYI